MQTISSSNSDTVYLSFCDYEQDSLVVGLCTYWWEFTRLWVKGIIRITNNNNTSTEKGQPQHNYMFL